MRPITLLLAAALVALALPLHAERTPPRNALFSDEDGTRVIVRYKADAALLRAHALSAGNTGSHARTLDDRAAMLAVRHGLAIRAAGAVSERVQVVSAEGVSARDLAARLALDADVESAVPDRRARATLVPNDTLFAAGPAVNLTAQTGGPTSGQWYLRTPTTEFPASIDAVSAWDTTTGSASVIVADLDTGITDHPDLAGKVLPGYDMVSDATVANDGNVRDADAHDPGDWVTSADLTKSLFSGCSVSSSSWHGTQTAGIIGATTSNGTGMAGAGWNVRILPVRVLGKCFGYTSDIAAGIRWAAGLSVPGVPLNPNKANVINLSLGSDGACSAEEQSAIDAAIGAGVVVVAAAGNSTGRAASSPSNCVGVIGVAAIRHVGSKVGFSDVGPQLSIAAPGGNCINIGAGEPCLYPILTTVNNGSTSPTTPGYTNSFNISVGTSFSSPLVAATAALMISADPTITPARVRTEIRTSARPFPSSGLADDPTTGPIKTCHAPDTRDQLQCYCTTGTCGAGMLDANASVAGALGLRASISVSPSAPSAGQTVTLDSSASTVPAGRTIATRQWTLVNGGGIVTAFSGSTNGISTTLVPSQAGSFTVQLTITDSTGSSISRQLPVTVTATPVAPPPTPSSGGGGPMSWAWLLGLALATAGVARTRPSRRRG